MMSSLSKKRCSCGGSDGDSSSGTRTPASPTEWPESEAVANFRKKKDELEIFMERIKEIKYEREDVQKKTQTKWINSMLSKGGHPFVKDLFNDLRDGTRLLGLLEVLTGQEYKREKGKMRVHHLNNVSRALQILKDNNVRLVNISNNEIVDGNGKITLALSWSIFLHWQVNDIMKNLMATTHQSNLEKALLFWCQTNTKPYPGVDIKNFSTSWSDGLAFGALLHRWRPDILDFANLASKTDPCERLEIAFKAAHDVLGIERLLDPEDVNTAIPDKKSVMMYVMCLFQSLAQSGLEPPPLPLAEELEEEIKQEVAKQEAELHKPPSEELISYQNIVEQVLSWLLIAEDRISSMDEISLELNEVKKQFQEHEKFMLSLTEHQGDVGEVLQEGSKILTEAKLPLNEIEEVRVQMKLLNTKWEDLRVKAMDRQNKIHDKLMTLQLAELEALKEFLTGTEDRISRMGSPPLEDLDALDGSFKEQQQLHEDILKQQERVVAFSNLVVVVDENNQDNEFANMEDQLTALSERWAHICSWTEKRGSMLQKLRTQAPNYLKKQVLLEDWLQRQEKRLKEVESNPNDTSEDSLMERYEKLQKLQNEMEEKMGEITTLQNSVQTLIDESCQSTVKISEEGEGNGFTGTKFLNKLEILQDRWEALSQIMEAQSQRITKYGVKPVEKSVGITDKLSVSPTTGVEMVDILALTKHQDFPKAKRTKIMNEFETSYGQVNDWVQRTESLIEVIPGSQSTTFDELSVDEQLILWEDLELELHSNEPVFQATLKDSNALIQHMKSENQNPSEVEEQVKSLTEKWEKVKDVLNKRKLLIDYLLAKKQLQAEISTMTTTLSAYEKWLETQGEVSPISNQPRKLLEQIRVKKKTMTSHEGRLAKLKAKASEVLEMDTGKADVELNAEYTQFASRWAQTVERLNLRLTQLEGINRMSAEEKYNESSHLIEHWLKQTETFLGEEIKFGDLKAMKCHQQKMKEILDDSKAHEDNLEVIINTSQKAQSPGEQVSALEELKGRYAEVKAVLQERNGNLTLLISKLDKWQEEMAGLEGWLEEVDVFVCAETMAVGDADFLEAQLEQSTALQNDVETLTATYTLLSTTGKELTHELEGGLLQVVKARMFKLNSHWSETLKKAGEQNVLLKDAYEKTKQVLRGIDETCEWLNQLNRDAPKLSTISNASDLARLTRKYQSLKDRVDKREESFRNLNDKCNELLLLQQNQEDEKTGTAIQDLAKTVTTLNSRWTDVTGTVDRNCQMLKEASFLYGEFRSLSAQEMDHLDRLEKKLKKPITQAADMEELSEDLDDIEQYVGDEQEARLSKLQEIGRKLVHENILVKNIQADVQQVTNRWTYLNQQAACRKTELENEMEEAEEWETLVQQLYDGLEFADKNLSARLEHDLSAEDFPDETEQLSEELKQQDKILKDMVFQVEVYRKAGKLEAAARLEEQKNMLQDRFKEVQSKFFKFASPPPESKIYRRIERVWRSLRQVEQALCFLELASDDPESILGQLNHCTKEYANLSALKREVELILKEGRRQTEDKKAEGKLSLELDSIKALYNKLGMQIASIRSSLEKGLALSTEMAEEMGSVEVWLEQSETELKGFFPDKEAELDFLRGRTEELPRWSKILESFNSHYESFLKLVDPVLLDSLKERRTLVLERWDLISHDIVRRHEEGLKEISVPDLEKQMESDKRELEDWLAKAEAFLNKMTSEGVMFSDEEIRELEDLNDNFNDMTDRLDSLKDKVVDLIVCKGDPYSFENDENLVVEKLAQRLETVGIQFQNLSSGFLDDIGDDSTALDSLSSNFKVASASVGGPPSKTRKLEQPLQPTTGICNFGFESEDDEELPKAKKSILTPQVSTDVELPLPRSPTEKRRGYSVQNVPEVSVTISRVTSVDEEIPIAEDQENVAELGLNGTKMEEECECDLDTENIETDEEFDGSLSLTGTPSEASTIIPTPPDSARLATKPPALTSELVEDSEGVQEDPYGFSKISSTIKAEVMGAPGRTTVKGECDKKEDDILAFEREGQEISKTMARMAKKLEEIEKDADPRKRVDALEIELISVEPEVALTISKGDSLIFKISKTDLNKAKQIRGALDLLRADWLQLKSRAERQRLAALKLETTQLECDSAIQDLEQWISNATLAPEQDKKKHLAALGKKSEEMKTLRKRMEELNKRNIRGFSPEFQNLEREFAKLEKILHQRPAEEKPAGVKTGSVRERSRIPIAQPKSPSSPKEVIVVAETISKQSAPAVPLKPKSPSHHATSLSPELVTKVNRLREQVATITRSLAASDDPMSVREELEKLSPRVIEIEELEESGIKGSPDQVLQAKRVIQKLLDEWATLNITHGQMVFRSPPSKSPSPSPSAMRSPDTSDIEDLETWLDEMDGLMNELKINPESEESRDESKNKLKDMESRISKRHRSVMLLMSKKSRMSPAYDDSARKMEKIGYRWRNLLAEMTIRRDRISGGTGMHRTLSKWWEPQVVLRDWIERANETVKAPLLISDETGMRNSLSNLKSLEHEIGSKRPDLEKLRQKKHLVSEDELAGFTGDIERLSRSLPDERKYVEQRLMSLRKLTSQLDTTTSWVLEVRAQVATAKHRPQEERAAAIQSIMNRVGEKEAEVFDVLCNYVNLENECEGKEQHMTPLMMEKVHQLKEDWVYVKSRGEINLLTPATEEKFCNFKLNHHYSPEGKEEVRISEGTFREVQVEVNKFQHQELLGSSPLPPPPALSRKELSPLVKSGGDSEHETKWLQEIQRLEDSMTLTLKSLKQQIVIIGNVEDVRNVLEKQKNVLRELEIKKPQLDELMLTAESLKSESNRHNLHVKVTKLREHWGETNAAVIGRKKELEDCLSDSSRWESQLKGIDEWFQSVESKLTHLNFSSHGNDHQNQKDQKNLEMELHQLKQEVDGFHDFTHHLIRTYHQDDPSRLSRTQDQLFQRYNYINNSLMLRGGRSYHSSPASLTTTMEQRQLEAQLSSQLGWIGELEMAFDGLENDLQRLGSTFSRDSSMARTTLQKLKELQSELESHANTVAALGGSARASAAGMDRPEDAQALLRRLDEMNQRWHGLKQRSMAIRNRLESNTEHWHALLLSLREIIEWVIRKDTELSSVAILGGDVVSLQKQMDDHRGFRRELDGKRPVVETNLISGRQHVANEPPVSDASDNNEVSKELEGDARGYRSAEAAARELTRSIRREVTKLSETWVALLARSDNRQIRLEDTIQRMRSFQQMLDDGSARLATAEAIKTRWPTIAAVGDKSTLLDQLKTFREHISSTQRTVNEINEQAGLMTGNNIMLSNSNVLRLDELNQRLRNLQLNVEERENELSSIGGAPPVASVIAVIPPSSNSSVSPPWERSLTPAKVPYFINHQTETTQWDHPLMTSILDSLSEYNDVRFSAYRTALKLRALQKEIRLDTLPLKTVIQTFDSLGLRGHNDRQLDVPDMVSTLNSLYNTCGFSEVPSGTSGSTKGAPVQQQQPHQLNIPLLTDLAINWILNVFDSQRTGQIRNLSFKIGVVLLCKGPMEDKFRYLFRLVADTTKQVDQRKLGLLLHDCMQIPRQLGEVAAFGGSNIEPSVRSCFEKAPRDRATIEVSHFLEWVRQEPQSIVWLPVLHRIAAAEGAKHQAKCNVCKEVPILGLRYRCLKCFNFDMCQKCFFSGKKAKNHKLTHPMQEYCTESTSGEDVRDFTRALKNRFKSKRSLQKHRKLGYLPVSSVLEGDMLESPSPAPSPQHSLSPDIHSRVDTYATRLADIEVRNRYNSTPDSEDEHSLIAQYCQSLTRGDGVIPRSPIQIVASIDAEQSEQLEAVIRALEEENASLQAEYDRLKHKSQANGQSFNSTPSDEQNLEQPPEPHPQNGGSGRNYYAQMDSNENNILAEARLLRQHKGRLEARMQILEEHNRQLEMQLQRLRQLLDEPKPNSPSKTGTLQSKSVVAAELAMDSPLPQRANGHFNNVQIDSWNQQAGAPEELRPPPPPTPGYNTGTGNDRPGDPLPHN